MKHRNIPSLATTRRNRLQMEQMQKVCRDTSVNFMRTLVPKSARWTLHHTVPAMAAKIVEISFFPLLFALAAGAQIAVQNRKKIVGM